MPSASEPDDRATIRAAEDRIFKAIMTQDIPALEAELADDFVHTTPGSPDQDRNAFLMTIREMPFRILDIGGEDLRVRVLGEMAILSGVQRARVRLPEGDVEGRTAFVDVFVRTGGGWRLSHGFSVDLAEDD